MSDLLRGLIMEILVMVPSYVLFWITGLTLSSQLELLLNIHRPGVTFFMVLSAERSA